MYRLSELITAYLAMDAAARVVFLAMAKDYAAAREAKRPPLRLIHGGLGQEAATDRSSDGLKKVSLGVAGRSERL